MRLALQIISWVNIVISVVFAVVGAVSGDSTTALGCWMFVAGLLPAAIVALLYADRHKPASEIDLLKAKIASLEERRVIQ
jgi:hypothetical protein